MNNIGLITKYATEAWDKVYKKTATCSVLDGEKNLMKFIGVKTVRIAKHSSDGMGWYARANKPVAGDYSGFTSGTAQGQGYGYPQGDVDLSWETFEIRIDRARQLRIELFDNEESGELAVTSALTDFSRTKVAPEVDAYVYSTLAQLAGHVSKSQISLASGMGYNANGPLQALNDAFTALEEAEVPEEDQVIFASPSFINKLRSTGEVVKVLKQTEYKENVDFTVVEYMGREIISVPQSRFRTKIVLNDNGFGWTTGSVNPDDDSKNIDFIVCAKEAVYHVTKYDKIRVFEPKLVQQFDGWLINVRVYHDCFVPDNKRVGVYVHVSGGTAPTPAVKFIFNDKTADRPATLSNVAIIPGDLMIDGLYVATSAPAIGAALTDISGEIAVQPYTDLVAIDGLSTATAYYLFAVRNGVVVANNTTDSFTISA